MDDYFNPQPKPPKRGPKPKRPLKRTVLRRKTPLSRRPLSAKRLDENQALQHRPVQRAEPRRLSQKVPGPGKLTRDQIRAKDRAFQVEGGSCQVCGVLPACWHHRRGYGRRKLKTRWDKGVCWRLCKTHHTEVHRIGESRFWEKYPALPPVQESESGQAVVLPL